MNDTFDGGCTDSENPGDSSQQERFLIVGIGASAGGVQALKAFFEHVPSGSGAAYVVILHLAPDHESRLAEILQSSASIPVHQVQQRERVQPNCVYVIPPNRSLSMDDGHVTLSEICTQQQRRAPIDGFFRALGETHQNLSVCVVLSGTGSDGSAGIKRVKERGGICIAQDPSEAAHGDMPRHAIATGVVDDVLAVAQIPAKIVAYKQHRQSVSRAATSGAAAADERAMRGILAQLRLRTGHDFTIYKPSTVLRRVQRRAAFHELADLSAYHGWLNDHPEEIPALLQDLLISVTEFFRDPAAFAVLELAVVPRLFEGKTSGDYVRVWVAGCATGEEVYSVAMLLCESARDPLNNPIIQIFATDLDEAALAKARGGYYSQTDVANIPPERLRRFFVQERDGYRVGRELREMILFATHNVTKHPPYSHLDLITCRNLLIYVNREAQKRLIELFHFGLKEGGFLFLGNSESLDGAADLFAPLDKEARIFQRRAGGRGASSALSHVSFAQTQTPTHSAAPTKAATPVIRPRPRAHELHRRVLERYAPPSVLINGNNEVVHLSERAGRYMRPVGGEGSLDLLNLIRAELKNELRAALYEAAQHGADVTTRAIALWIDGATESVSLIIRAVPPAAEDETGGFTLVLFSSSPAPTEDKEAQTATSVEVAPALRHAENELAHIRTELRAKTAEYELQQGELQASNEELQSINEELRSTSEELETGKEELQSYNEELSTINQELKVKIEELSQANNDTRNFINSAETATVFLDRELRIKRFTPPCAELFNLLVGDIGRPFLQIKTHLKYEELSTDVADVLTTLQVIRREVQADGGAWYSLRLLPYRTENDRIDGVVLTLADITERKRAEEALSESEEQFRRAIEDAPIPVIMQAQDGQVLQLSQTWTQLTGYGVDKAPPVDGWLSRAYGQGADDVRTHMRELFDGTRTSLNAEFSITTLTGEQRWWSFSASSPGNLRDGRRFIVGMAVDVTDSRRAAEALRRSEERLRLTLESVTDYAIFTTDDAGTIESWNAGAERIFGYTEAEALGQNGAIIFTPEDRVSGAPEEEMRTARRNGAAADERWHIRKNGERFYASGVLSRVGTENDGLIAYSKIAQDLTEKKRAEEELQQARTDLEARVEQRTRQLAQTNEWLQQQVHERERSEKVRVQLLGQLVQAQENERRRISRELHDQLGQQITALRLKVSSLTGDAVQLSPQEMQQELLALGKIATQLDDDVDFLVWELRPMALDDLGLFDALTDYVGSWSKLVDVKAQLHARLAARARLPEPVETTLYRITQEALNNVAKHARARHVNIVIERGTADVSLTIADDGIGFEPRQQITQGAKTLGLVSIHERATLAGGVATIESSLGNGTTVFVQLPLAGIANSHGPDAPEVPQLSRDQ